MYCPRCRIEVGEDIFCENCGGATVASSEVAATATAAQNKIPQFIQEDIQKEKIKIEAPKFSFKKVIGIAAAGIMAIGIVAGYKALQAQYTPKSTVEKFYNYIVKDDYKSAYKMLVNTDDKFLTEENFEASMKSKKIKTFYIKNYNPNEYPQSYDMNQSQKNINGFGNMFSVQGSGKLYPVSVVENGKKLMFFKDYKIDAQTFTVRWQMSAPIGAKVTINDKEPEVSTEPNMDNLTLGSAYKPETTLYQIDRMFDGTYDIIGTMEGAEDVKLAAAPAGKKETLVFIPKADTVQKLKEQAKAFLDLYYAKASEDKFTSLLTGDSNAMNRIKGIFGGGWGSDNVINKLQDIKVTKQSIGDVNHASITVKCTIYYEDSSMVSWGGTKQTGTNDMTTEFYFERQNGNWLIVDTSYIN